MPSACSNGPQKCNKNGRLSKSKRAHLKPQLAVYEWTAGPLFPEGGLQPLLSRTSESSRPTKWFVVVYSSRRRSHLVLAASFPRRLPVYGFTVVEELSKNNAVAMRRYFRKQNLVVWLLCIVTVVLLMVWISQNCRQNFRATASALASTENRIYVITPTYARPVQKAELTRLSHTFRLVINLHWIVVEDASVPTPLVGRLLQNSQLSFTHLHVATPAEMKLKSTDRKWIKPRGVLQRNQGLQWIRAQQSIKTGVVYFADDDNTYDLQLFEDIRSIKTVGVWPVAFVGEIMVEKPMVENGQVVGWDVAYKPDRPFAVDMAGFAVNVQLIQKHSKAAFSLDQPVGHQESHLLNQLDVQLADLEPKAELCTKVLVWHTRTEKINLVQEKRWNVRGKFSAADMEI